jgi:hypothetical protein
MAQNINDKGSFNDKINEEIEKKMRNHYNGKVRSSSIFWGLFFIFLGIFFLLHQFGLWNYNLSIILDFWPLLLVLWGLSILKIPGLAKKFLSGIAGIFLALLLISLITYQWHWNIHKNMSVIFNDENGGNDTLTTYEKVLTEPYDSTNKNVCLNLDAGAGSYDIKDTATGLLDVYSYKNLGELGLNKSMDNGELNLNLDMTLNKFWKKNSRKAEIRLSTAPVWDMNLKVGASDFECDFSYYKLRNISVKGGAANIELKFGSLGDSTFVNVDVGAASVEIKVPSTVGCQITSNTGLSSLDINGFKKNEAGYYTENFASSNKKIFLIFKGGVSSFDVSRY